jgi:tRNA A37 threonylcarbamoyladenosine biosynthesis protein TsaE
MEYSFVEKIDLRSAHYLSQQLSSEYYSSNEDGTDEQMKYGMVKKVLLQYIKQNGTKKTVYHRSSTDTLKCLRLYGLGLQGLPKAFRGLLYHSIGDDIDGVNFAPSIIYNLCRRYDIPCQYLAQYCNHRADILSKWTTKLEVNKIMNKAWKVKNGNPWVIAFDDEVKRIQASLIQHYPELYALAKSKNPKNANGTLLSYVYQFYETKILEKIVETCPYEITALVFDGFMVKGNVPESYLQDLHDLVKREFDMDLQFIVKPHDTSIKIPDDFNFDDADQLYQQEKEKQETVYGLAFIKDTSSYAIKVGGQYAFKTKGDLFNNFQNVFIKDKRFIERWCDDDDRAEYNKVGMYCHDVKCPDDVLNLWSGFAASKLNTELVDIEPFFHHLRIMSNHNEDVFQFLIKWLANMFQFPSTPSIFVSLSGDEGSGKSALTQLITNMVGVDKSIEIDNPTDQLFGTFTGHLQDKVFVNLNEVSRKDMCKYKDRLKSAINSPFVVIHEKGQKAFTITNVRHYFCTTNHDHAVIVNEGNRRYVMIRSSPELIGNHEYHTGFYNWIDRPSVQYSVYQYLMTVPVPKKFTNSDLPITELMKDAYELNKDPMEDFMMDFTSGITSDELYVEYKEFMRRHGYEGICSSKAFFMKFAKYKDQYRVEVKQVDKLEDGIRVRGRCYFRGLLIGK